jgi:hypothetical protein
MLKLTSFFVLGTVFVSAIMPQTGEGVYKFGFLEWGDKDTCENHGCTSLPEDECEAQGGEMYDIEYKESSSDYYERDAEYYAGSYADDSYADDSYADPDADDQKTMIPTCILDTGAGLCNCNVQFLQPTNPHFVPQKWLVQGDKDASCNEEETHYSCKTQAEYANANFPVRCCSSEDINGWTKNQGCSISSKTNTTTCPVLDWHQANEFCEEFAEGSRLCTQEELESNCAKSTECGFDGRLIWSSTPAAPWTRRGEDDEPNFPGEEDGTWPCGYAGSMLRWNEDWDMTTINGTQTGSIDMTSKNAHNADYFDCTAHGGQWRAVEGDNEFEHTVYSGPHQCRATYHYYSYDGPSPPDVDFFLCKKPCKANSTCPTPVVIKTCQCTGGSAEPDWRKCFKVGNEQCISCHDPNAVLIAHKNNNTVTCETYEPYHLYDCGRDPGSSGMRILPKSWDAPYSVEMCAYWVKQDPDCEKDYFYSLNHLELTDFKIENWETFKAYYATRIENPNEHDWDDEQKTFLKEWERDMPSYFEYHKQKKYGCHCRARLNQTIWKEQQETWYGFMGNVYKFDSVGDTAPTYGPLMVMDPLPQHECIYPNYKIDGLSGYWGCPAIEPQPIWGWVLSDGTNALGSPQYYKMFQHLGEVVNLENGRYSFLCYAGEGRYKMFRPHMMRSWGQGPVSIGTKYKHNAGGLCGQIGGSNHVELTYEIDGEHDDAQNRTMFFVIENWDFEDGRIEFAGTEAVNPDYDPREDTRFNAFETKFTEFYPWTMSVRIDRALMDMAAKRTYMPDCDEAGVEAFSRTMHDWLMANKNAGFNYTQYEDDTKEGIYYPDETTNSDLVMEWYFDSMAAASENYLDVRRKGIECKKFAFPDRCSENGEWADDYEWPNPMPPARDPLAALTEAFAEMFGQPGERSAERRDVETEPEMPAARESEAKPKKTAPPRSEARRA